MKNDNGDNDDDDNNNENNSLNTNNSIYNDSSRLGAEQGVASAT